MPLFLIFFSVFIFFLLFMYGDVVRFVVCCNLLLFFSKFFFLCFVLLQAIVKLLNSFFITQLQLKQQQQQEQQQQKRNKHISLTNYFIKLRVIRCFHLFLESKSLSSLKTEFFLLHTKRVKHGNQIHTHTLTYVPCM